MTGNGIAEVYPWLLESWQLLTRQEKQQCLPHALLLTGPEGIGKVHLAVQLSAYLLCEQKTENAVCGACKSCHLIRAGTHPDFMNIAPEEKGKAIKVDQIRGINHFAAQTAQLGGYKIVLINPADALNINAANALLKNLEEPSGKSLFILITNQPSLLVATIRSRCNNIAIPLPKSEVAQSWLEQHAKESEVERLALLLKLANGAPLLALDFNVDGFLERREKLFHGLKALQQSQSSATEVAQQWQAIDLLTILNWIDLCLADLIKLRLATGTEQIKNLDQVKFLSATAAQVSVNKLYLYGDRLLEAKRGLLSGNNPNKILLLEDLLMRWSRCFLP